MSCSLFIFIFKKKENVYFIFLFRKNLFLYDCCVCFKILFCNYYFAMWCHEWLVIVIDLFIYFCNRQCQINYSYLLFVCKNIFLCFVYLTRQSYAKNRKMVFCWEISYVYIWNIIYMYIYLYIYIFIYVCIFYIYIYMCVGVCMFFIRWLRCHIFYYF